MIPPPVSIKSKPVTSTEISISWRGPRGRKIQNYTIEYKTTGAYSSLVTLPNMMTSYRHSGLVTGTTYTYRIYAVSATETSLPSAETSATPTILHGSPSVPTRSYEEIHQSTTDAIAKIQAELVTVNTRLDQQQSQIDSMNAKIIRINTDIASLDSRVSALELI